MARRWEAIREAAAQARARLAVRLGIPVSDLPVRIDAKQLARVYRLSATLDGYLPANVHAVLDPVGRLIRVRRDASPEDACFSILHELGHAELEGLKQLIIDGPKHITADVIGTGEQEKGVLREYNRRERREQDANLFALEVLIPAEDLWQQLALSTMSIDMLTVRYGATPTAVQSQIVNVLLNPPLHTRHPAPLTQRRHSQPLHVHQQQAVTDPLPMLVVAGPGTGKTFCLVERYRALLREGMRPEQILVLTFNNKAAEELRERLIRSEAGAQPVGTIHIYTFHAFGLELLRQHYQQVNLPAGFQLITAGEAYILLKRRLESLPLVEFKSLKRPTQWLDDLMSAVSRAKDELITVDQFAAAVEAEVVELHERIAPLAVTGKAKDAKEVTKLQIQITRLRELAAFYAAYQTMLHELNVVDYGDLVMLPAEMLARDPTLATQLRDTYRVILVDEVQDINYASGELVRQLDGGRRQVWAVGDICQSIYGFRGASPFHIETFQESYAPTARVYLSRNFRSVPEVVRTGDVQIAGVRGAAERPRLHAARRVRPGERALDKRVAPTSGEELLAIVRLLRASVAGRPFLRNSRAVNHDEGRRVGRSPGTVGRVRKGLQRRRMYGDHAILCNTREQATTVAATLRRNNIPVEHVGNVFDQPHSKDLLALCTLWRSGDMSGLLRVLTTADYQMSQADIDTLQVAGVAAVGGVRRVLTRIDEIPGLSDAGRACLRRLQRDLQVLNQTTTAWQLLTRYLFGMSPAFQALVARAAGGSLGEQRVLQQIGQVLAVARSFAKPTSLFAELTPTGFVRHLRELLESRYADVGSDDYVDRTAVRVMTIHRSKGLEFPVVIVPFLAEGQFPRNKVPSSRVPTFSRIVHGTPLTREDEQRYLCYVALTRARDRLVLLRAQEYDGESRAATPLLPLDTCWRKLPRGYVTRSSSAVPPVAEGRLLPSMEAQQPLAARAVDTYRKCPRRYLYQEVYRIRTPRDAYGRMRWCIDEAARRLRSTATEQGALPPPDVIETLLDTVWQEQDPGELPYNNEYRDLARRQLVAVAAELLQDQQAEQAAVPITVELNHGQVALLIDRIELRGSTETYVLAQRGEYDEQHRTSTRSVLAMWHYQQQFPEVKPQVELVYPFSDDLPKPVVYRDGTLEKQLALINHALTGIVARQFPTEPERFKCASCPFALICPV